MPPKNPAEAKDTVLNKTVHTPVDRDGAIITDRAFTDAEAAAVDAANREVHVKRRQERFRRRASRTGS